jgi:choline-glycine betaine transporter
MSDKEAAIAGAVGTTVGAAGSLGTVAAAGTVTGLGATGITSGLAAIGGVVGGGMAAGLVVTVAAPVVIGATAYGIYKWIKE